MPNIHTASLAGRLTSVCYHLLLYHWQDWPACVASYCYITDRIDQRVLPVAANSLAGLTSMCYQLLLIHWQDWPACVTSYCYITDRTDQRVTSYGYITNRTDQRVLPVTATSLTGLTSMCYQLLLHHWQEWPACVASYCYITDRTDLHV